MSQSRHWKYVHSWSWWRHSDRGRHHPSPVPLARIRILTQGEIGSIVSGMTATSARPNRGVKRVSVALIAAMLLTLTACYPELPEPAPPRVLKAPTSVTAVAGDGEVTVSWVAPSINSRERIEGYTVTSSEGDITEATGTHVTVTGLTNGTTYTFTVTATNSHGTSPASEPSNEVIPTAP